MQNVNPIIIIIIGCCLWPLLTFFLGGFVFTQVNKLRRKKNQPMSKSDSSASGRFVTDDDS
jgi:hypothetical protein